MNRIYKISSLLIFLFIINLIQSCGPSMDGYIGFDITHIQIQNLSNTGSDAVVTTENTMLPSAVAFKVRLYEGSNSVGLRMQPQTNFGFTSCVALSPPDFYYKSNQLIQNIRVVTLVDYSTSIVANTDVSDKFLVYPIVPAVSDFLYVSIPEFCTLTTDQILMSPSIEFHLMCKETLSLNNAQFRIIVELSNGQELSIDTALLDLVTND
ncbi:MAG TPA: hypothetical protein PLK02_00145 [Paludibacteraceae bacterium]|nr:hypothetical protein [Paludibacteraceae bacterium]